MVDDGREDFIFKNTKFEHKASWCEPTSENHLAGSSAQRFNYLNYANGLMAHTLEKLD